MQKQAYALLAVFMMVALNHAAYADRVEGGIVDSGQINTTHIDTGYEHQIVELSGFLSLSTQVKFRAQTLTNNSVNRAQQFAVANQLSKQWSHKIWKSRLLTLVQSYSIEEKKVLLQQLEHPIFQMSQDIEREGMSDLQSERYSEYKVKLQRHPPTLLRRKMIAELDGVSRFSEIMGLIEIEVANEVKNSVTDWKLIESEEQSSYQEVEDFLFYAYRKTPNAELKRIIHQFKQRQIQQFYRDTRDKIKRI